VRYEVSYPLSYVRGPEGIIVELAERIAPRSLFSWWNPTPSFTGRTPGSSTRFESCDYRVAIAESFAQTHRNGDDARRRSLEISAGRGRHSDRGGQTIR
jgi:hypothetical protein